MNFRFKFNQTDFGWKLIISYTKELDQTKLMVNVEKCVIHHWFYRGKSSFT